MNPCEPIHYIFDRSWSISSECFLSRITGFQGYTCFNQVPIPTSIPTSAEYRREHGNSDEYCATTVHQQTRRICREVSGSPLLPIMVLVPAFLCYPSSLNKKPLSKQTDTSINHAPAPPLRLAQHYLSHHGFPPYLLSPIHHHG